MIKFEKGKYYIGDLCYVIKGDNWSNLLDNTDYFRLENQQYKGHTIYSKGTTYGDGCYEDNEGRVYCVDSGSIGIIPIELVEGDRNRIKSLGNIITFSEDFFVSVDDGVFIFGNVIIDTNFDEENEDDEYEDNEYEDDDEYEY